jgi:hypothetical protein
MGNFVLVYVGGSQPASEEEGKAVMDAWMAWFGTLGDAVVDGGNPFGASASIAPGGAVSEGSGSGATGYSVLRADDLAAATALAQGCPHLSAGGTVEVHEAHEVM